MEFFLILGNNGYPVTHFWVHQEDGIYFESKGTHDHFRPQARRATPDRSSINKQNNAKQNSEQDESTEEKTEKREVKYHVLHDTKMRQARAIARSNHMQFSPGYHQNYHEEFTRITTCTVRKKSLKLPPGNHLQCACHEVMLSPPNSLSYIFFNKPVK